MRALLILLVSLTHQNSYADWYNRSQNIMGTQVSAEIFHASESVADTALDAVMQEMRRINVSMSPHIESSDLSQVNTYASLKPVAVSDELIQLVKKAHSFSELTNGAFDISFASVGFHYDYRAHQRPDEATRDKAATLTNYKNIKFPDTSHIAFENEGMKMDLGGIAKGHAVDMAIEKLHALGIEHARVTAGGDTRVIGQRWGRPWQIGVRAPRDGNSMIATIPLVDVAISTSGDYERFFEQDGVRYHHIIDPKTGDSARHLQSVTIIGPDATSTDALSTSVFVMGVRAGLALVNSMPDVDAILVDAQGELHLSNGLLNQSNPDSPLAQAPLM